MQEYKWEQEDASHHWKGANVVRIRTGDEPLVLGVLQRSYRNLGSAVEAGVADAIVVDFELVNAVDVGYLKLGLVLPVGQPFQGGAYEWVNADELQLNVVGSVRFPFTIVQNVDFNGVDLDVQAINMS